QDSECRRGDSPVGAAPGQREGGGSEERAQGGGEGDSEERGGAPRSEGHGAAAGPPVAPSPPLPVASSPRPPLSLRVLVVDDNADAAETLAEMLQIWGCDVCVAHDGLSAIEAARASVPAVILLDIGLPGM